MEKNNEKTEETATIKILQNDDGIEVIDNKRSIINEKNPDIEATLKIKREYEKAMVTIKKLLNDKYPNLNLTVVKVGNAYIVYQGTPSIKWASFRIYTPSIYRASLRRILEENGIIKKYKNYFRGII